MNAFPESPARPFRASIHNAPNAPFRGERAIRKTAVTGWRLGAALLFGVLAWWTGAAGDEPDVAPWMERIRDDHPRLMFNRDDIDGFRAAAAKYEAHFAEMRERAAGLPEPDAPEQTRDYGNLLMNGAVVYQVTGSREMLDRIRAGLHASLRFYHRQYEREEPVSWYAWSRLSWLVALDVVWNDLDEEERVALSRSFMRHLLDFDEFGRNIRREGTSPPVAGFYGAQNLFWFAGLLWHGEGIDDDLAQRWLEQGYPLYMEMLENRRSAAGEDGGAASGSLNYALNQYPVAKWNFFHSFRAAIGYDLAQDWPHVTRLPDYIWWNWLPGGLQFGYGDTSHITNRLPGHWLPTHMAHILHFYGDSHPEAAARAHDLKRRALDEGFAAGGGHADGFRTSILGIYPYLLSGVAAAPDPVPPVQDAPLARRFANMGQIFIRTGDEPDDVFVLISAGGHVRSHRHYDAGHFTLYHRGFLALDSGTRLNEDSDHLYTYYSQTIAHNTLLIYKPDEEPPRFWGRPAAVVSGGQHRVIGSGVVAFEVEDDWVHVACDLSPVYHPSKSEEVLRQFVFLRPNVLVIFDRVRSTDAAFPKTWLLHTALEPRIDGRRVLAEQDEGRLIATTLLPENPRIEPVGGPGREFWVVDRNVPFSDDPDDIADLMGRWRVEVSPPDANEQDFFLHVLEVGDRSMESTTDGRMQKDDDQVRVRLQVGDGEATIRFALEGEPKATVTFRE